MIILIQNFVFVNTFIFLFRYTYMYIITKSGPIQEKKDKYIDIILLFLFILGIYNKFNILSRPILLINPASFGPKSLFIKI